MNGRIIDLDGGVYLQDPDGQGWHKVDPREPGLPWQVAVSDDEMLLQWLLKKQELAKLTKTEERILKDLMARQEMQEALDKWNQVWQEAWGSAIDNLIELQKRPAGHIAKIDKFIGKIVDKFVEMVVRRK